MKRLLLIDDHQIFRTGLKHIIGDAFPGTTYGETDKAEEALQLVMWQDWDLVILELSVNANGGLELLKEIKKQRPKIPVLIVTGHSEKEYALRTMKAGAAGYIGTSSPNAELVKAIHKVLQGGRYVSMSLAEALTADLHRKGPELLHELLSDREFQVLRLIGSGKTVGEIAVLLGISDKTVSTYRARILDKTGLRNNAELVRYVVQHGLAD